LRAISIVAKGLFILCLPVLLVTTSLGWAVNSLWLYQYGFEKYHVGATTGLSEPELEKTAIGLIDYFNSGEEYINLTVIKNNQPFVLFNEREIIHLKDVKGLIRLDYWVWLGTAIYVIGYVVSSLFWSRHRYRPLARVLVGGGGLTLALMLALGLWALVDFGQLLLQFHLLSFANEFWQLDPTHDYLIMLFPEGFFYDATLICAGATTAGAIMLGGVGGGYLLLTRGKK
jgi:integral membrane protein (TIGR01906 family)